MVLNQELNCSLHLFTGHAGLQLNRSSQDAIIRDGRNERQAPIACLSQRNTTSKPSGHLVVIGAIYKTALSSARAASLSIGTRPMIIFAVFGSSTTSKPSSLSCARVSG